MNDYGNKEQEVEKDKENIIKQKKINDYKVRKKSTLQKHIITKECKEKCTSFMELPNYVAKYHTEDPVEMTDTNDKGEN